MEPSDSQRIRRRFELRGQVQGVGLRPYVYRLAAELGLTGSVANDSNGATIEVEGTVSRIAEFEQLLLQRLPPLARIARLERRDLPPHGDTGFWIRPSVADAATRPEVTPDAAICADCLRELLDPRDRRYRYPFINCTNCGPRYSIICTVPYDRPATTMAEFTMCAACQREYDDPTDRRFHAQPNACPACGPHLTLCRPDRSPIEGDPIPTAAKLLADGGIIAVKGIGGYHLACRADLEESVGRLRERKLRDGKPLAIMVKDETAARRVCALTPADVVALTSVAAPIVLAPQAAGHGLTPSVAPGCGTFGVMLPYAPVHHLLFAEGLGPLVMTSANLAGQPLTYEDDDALATLGDVADAFLLHNRRIFRPIDDSVVFTFREDVVPIRWARGYAPRPVRLAKIADDGLRMAKCVPTAARRTPRILAVGAELKSTVCLYSNGEATLSEHLGDLTRPDTYRHFVRAIDRLKELLDFTPDLVAHDLHPQILSTRYAQRLGIPTLAVQHHHAHIASVMAEWDEAGPVVGLACDGVGYGTDGAVWGCEVLRCERGGFERWGHLEYVPLVGGDLAAVETWRPAAALLRAATGDDWREHLARAAANPDFALSERQLDVYEQQLGAGVNAPPSSSLGRVFDGVSYLLGLCARNRHEAEAAMALEAAAGSVAADPYPYERHERAGLMQLSVRPTIGAIVDAVRAQRPMSEIAARFHEAVARLLSDAAIDTSERTGVRTVGLSGGCFANRRLLTRVVAHLEARGLRVLYHRVVPCGDGGIALGQATVAAWQSLASGPATPATERAE